MTSLHMICGLAPHPIQNPGYAHASNHMHNKYRLLHCFQSKSFFGMEVWNGRKLPEWNMEKSSSIPCPAGTLGVLVLVAKF